MCSAVCHSLHPSPLSPSTEAQDLAPKSLCCVVHMPLARCVTAPRVLPCLCGNRNKTSPQARGLAESIPRTCWEPAWQVVVPQKCWLLAGWTWPPPFFCSHWVGDPALGGGTTVGRFSPALPPPCSHPEGEDSRAGSLPPGVVSESWSPPATADPWWTRSDSLAHFAPGCEPLIPPVISGLI